MPNEPSLSSTEMMVKLCADWYVASFVWPEGKDDYTPDVCLGVLIPLYEHTCELVYNHGTRFHTSCSVGSQGGQPLGI